MQNPLVVQGLDTLYHLNCNTPDLIFSVSAQRLLTSVNNWTVF